ncbi:MAG: uracil-DNA glycosylase [Cellvibrionaceae bacterium]|nr:uracil-DNA glycosylase [Cellvibrionaceae bacterium]
MRERELQLEASWKALLEGEFEQPYMQQLRQFLQAEKQAGKTIYPPGPLMFNALNTTPFDQVKVVILGQDPYHGPGQAHGLSFSVPEGIKTPPSLQNIYKEINRDLGLPIPNHGCLQHWAEQGVLLLNATLSVQQAQAGSHQKKGWEQFTDKIVALLNERREGLVFMLWGSYAQKKGRIIDPAKHCVLKSVHPSPLSAHRGFIGCGHFSAANNYLQQRGLSPIEWGSLNLPS